MGYFLTPAYPLIGLSVGTGAGKVFKGAGQGVGHLFGGGT
jgi:hypothetical protein